MRWPATLQALHPWLDEVDALVFPRLCVICEAPSEPSGLCASCIAELRGAGGTHCRRCAATLRGAAAAGPSSTWPAGCSECRRRRPRFDAAVALGPYVGPLRHLCLRMKHPGSGWLAARLTDLLLETESAWLRGWLTGPDASPAGACVVAIPLHWWRRWRRGYNQADELAAALARRLELRRLQPLRRAVATPHLAGLSVTERAAVMRQAIRPSPRAAAALAGRDVLLVDDVLTTGATCNAAARALKRAGARRVMAVVIARTEGEL